MLKRNMLLCVIISVCLAITVVAQNVPAAGGQPGQNLTNGAIGGRDNAADRGIMGPGGVGFGIQADPRVQNRTYLFKDTNETLPYAVFVSSKVTKDKKAPLIMALRGAGGSPTALLSRAALDRAEEGGYILVSALGYTSMGSFGMTAGGRDSRYGRSGTPATTPDATQQGNLTARGVATGGRGMGTSTRGGGAETDPVKVSEYSEKDVMNVLAIVRKEFNVDDRRIYLMGHSQGGAGALHIADKYSSIWAAAAMLSPGAPNFQLDPNSQFKNVPLLIMVGANDTLIATPRRIDEQLKSMNIAHEYKEVPGLDHGGIVIGAIPEVFKFFGEHSKPDPNSSPDSAASRTMPYGTKLDPLVQMSESQQFAKSVASPNSPQWQAKGDQRRAYRFPGTSAEIPYRIYVPTTWYGKSKLPLVMMLHGGGSNENMYLDQNNKQLLKLAEQHGYLLVSPMGYSPTGAYGTCLRLPAVFGQPEAAKQMIASLTPDRIRSLELSEKDVINVLEIVLNEYPVDRSSMFLTGHSMGSGGTWYLGAKYSQYWAAIAPMSGPFVDEDSYLWDNIRKMPIFMTEGTGATPSLAGSRKMREWMKDHNFKLDYKEVNADHGGMVPLVLPDVFDFFDRCRGK
jgi:predicted peptidase